MKKVLLALILSSFWACSSEQSKPETEILLEPEAVAVNKFSNPEIVRIYDFTDRRMTDSLLVYLQNPSAVLRAEAAEALASVQDSAALPALLNLLFAPEPEVRRAAVYALGQSGEKSVFDSLLAFYEKETDENCRIAALDAAGKCADEKSVKKLHKLETADEIGKYAKISGLYRALIGGASEPAAAEFAVNCLAKENSRRLRLRAGHFLARMRDKKFKKFEKKLIDAAFSETDAEVRMVIASALGGVKTRKSREKLADLVRKDADYRVKINAIRALAGEERSDARSAIRAGLTDTNPNTAVAAAAALLTSPGSQKEFDYLGTAALIKNRRAAALLTAAAVKIGQGGANNKAMDYFRKAGTDEEKALFAGALSENPTNFDSLSYELTAAKTPVLQAALFSALQKIAGHKDFRKKVENGPEKMLDILADALRTDNPTLITLSAEMLGDPDRDFKKTFADTALLSVARGSLQLPRDTEAALFVDKTLRYFRGQEEPDAEPAEFSNPIDFELVKTLPADLQAVIRTDKGSLTVRLFPEKAPGSVANFVKLARQGFFDDIAFHRIVPNFVVQGGCPRSDGFGGPDHTIRSEFAQLSYETGMLGMASAGKDTEGSQWFISHSPAPHLDGRYSIFGKIEAGEEVFQRLELYDKILEISFVGL